MFKLKFDSKIKSGYYTANYFKKTAHIVKKYQPNNEVVMQFTHFNKTPVKVCGIEESVSLIKSTIGLKNFHKIKIYGKQDGDIAESGESVIIIIGPYELFAVFENIVDGILARRSSVCNNCYQMLKFISSDQLIYMADRTDDYRVQPYDGYAAYVGGVRNFVTEASIELIKNKKDINITGTMPHALIQQYDGNLSAALHDYIKEYGTQQAVALIDYHNDVQHEIKLLSKDFSNLFAVRVDTSANLIDEGLVRTIKDAKNNPKLYGVSPELIKLTRKTLNESGFWKTKIIASSGINIEKIENFQKANAPVDYYGVGSNLITRNVHFTADLVMKNKKPQSKTGRKLFLSLDKLKKMHSYR